KSGCTKSCGCLLLEHAAALGARYGGAKRQRTGTPGARRHGHAARGRLSRVYQIWGAMVARCTNPKSASFANYGGRGVTVCPRWLTFANFIADMGEPPSPRHSIDRVDNDGPYDLANCRWATRRQQARNTRRTIYVEVAGERMSLAEAVERLGLKYGRAYYRLITLGWPAKRALSTS
ncbi:MAG: hypothetical protein ABI629_08760, partial [bacterium]